MSVCVCLRMCVYTCTHTGKNQGERRQAWKIHDSEYINSAESYKNSFHHLRDWRLLQVGFPEERTLENSEEARRLQRVINVLRHTHQLALLGWPLCGLSTLNLRHILELDVEIPRAEVVSVQWFGILVLESDGSVFRSSSLLSVWPWDLILRHFVLSDV